MLRWSPYPIEPSYYHCKVVGVGECLDHQSYMGCTAVQVPCQIRVLDNLRTCKRRKRFWPTIPMKAVSAQVLLNRTSWAQLRIGPEPNNSLEGAFQFGEGHSNCRCHGLGHSVEGADSNFVDFHPTDFDYGSLVSVIVGVMPWVTVVGAIPLLVAAIRIVGGVAATLGWKWLMSGEEGRLGTCRKIRGMWVLEIKSHNLGIQFSEGRQWG